MKKVYCPYCKKEVDYKIEKRNIKYFKGVEINTYENVAICNYCNNDLYINSLEDENNERIYNLYREKVNIIRPQDIINFRKKYNISQRELTGILGYGKMTINRYERGDLPTKSHSDYMKLLINNEDEFINKVKEAYSTNNISKKTYEKIVLKSENKSKINFNDLLKEYLIIDLTRAPDIYNGYKEFDLEIAENIISYIASKVNNLTITSLNKYLWFIDIISFNKRGVSITGLTYQKQQYGPTIINKKYQELSYLNEKYIRNDYDDENGTKTYITSNNNYDLSKLNENEIEIINKVIKILKSKKVTEISDLSHKEEGWIKTKKFDNISFKYAENLNIDKL